MKTSELKQYIENIYDSESFDVVEAIEKVDLAFSLLNNGTIRVAEKVNGHWRVNRWVKKAILLGFRLKKNTRQDFDAFDKFGLLRFNYEDPTYRKVPGAVIRDGVYIGNGAVIMPSYINTGAFIGGKTMVDINSVVGSCAQVGENCHISALACIGGVLEPVVSDPVIIEDNCFIGAQSSVLEGVVVEENSVIASGVTISGSTKIINRQTGEITTGRIKAGSVVVSGSYPSNGINISCAVIIKTIDRKTKLKSCINELLRD